MEKAIIFSILLFLRIWSLLVIGSFGVIGFKISVTRFKTGEWRWKWLILPFTILGGGLAIFIALIVLAGICGVYID